MYISPLNFTGLSPGPPREAGVLRFWRELAACSAADASAPTLVGRGRTKPHLSYTYIRVSEGCRTSKRVVFLSGRIGACAETPARARLWGSIPVPRRPLGGGEKS